jgi:hypothetical protein
MRALENHSLIDQGENLPPLAYPLHGFGFCCSRRESLDMSQRLTAIPSPFGPRCLHVLLAAFSRFLGVLGRLGLAAHSSVISCPISSRRSDVFLAAFCGLLGVLLLPLLTHACPPSLRILFAVTTRKIPSRTHTSAARSANGCGAAWDASGHAGEALYVSPNPHTPLNYASKLLKRSLWCCW